MEENTHEDFAMKFKPGLDHEVHIYKEYHSLCPFVGIGTPHPLSRK
jgi:hypothetical protein